MAGAQRWLADQFGRTGREITGHGACAIVVQRLRGLSEPDPRTIEAYRELVGAARDAASRHITENLSLESDLGPMMVQHGASEPWEVLTAMRTEIYGDACLEVVGL